MADQSFSRAFGATIAVVLLGLYTATVICMVSAVVDCEKANQAALPGGTEQGAAFSSACVDSRVTSGTIYVVTTVGGLVSALVVAVLAATPPGVSPGMCLVSEKSGKVVKTSSNIVVIAYLVVWACTGLAALSVGSMMYPDASKTLASLGATWLGIAIAAGYAYFSLNAAPSTR